MGQGGCVDGQLVTTSYASPVPIIGLYIAAASLVCFCLMSFDLVYGFIRKKPLLPCKSFPLNSITLTIVGVATKIPVDLTTSMPRVEDQLSKLTGTALMCTVIGLYMPSLGSMSTSERYGNLAALTTVAITMVVNVCIQMRTGVIFAFTIEHITIMVCTLILILLMWSSSIAFRGHEEFIRDNIVSELNGSRDHLKGVRGLKKLIGDLHAINYMCNPQTLLCENPHHLTSGLLCATSAVAVSQAMVRTFALKSVRLCTATSSSSSSGVSSSDYEWSICIVIVTQLLTIAVGTFSIIYRCFAVAAHTDVSALQAFFFDQPQVELELEYLKFEGLSFVTFRSRSYYIFKVFLVAKDFMVDVLICTQLTLHVCSAVFTLPFSLIIMLLMSHDFHKPSQKDGNEEKSTTSCEFLETAIETQDDFKSSLKLDYLALRCLFEKASKNVTRWTSTYQSGDYCPTHLISFMSEFRPALPCKSECADLVRELGRVGEKNSNKWGHSNYSHRVSCLSVVVLSEFLAALMPSFRTSGEKSLKPILEESLEIIYYVEQKTTNAPNSSDKARWRSVKYFWGRWEDPKDWSLEKFEESQLELDGVLEILSQYLKTIRKHLNHNCRPHSRLSYMDHLDRVVMTLERATICEFILDQKHESVKGLLDFLEMCFVKLLCFSLSGLPRAILKEIHEEYPSEIGEDRTRRALKFVCKLDQLSQGTKIEWSRPVEFEPETQPTDDISQMVASCSSAPRVEVSDVVQQEPVGNSDASVVVIHDASTAATPAAADADDDDRIVELGSLENV